MTAVKVIIRNPVATSRKVYAAQDQAFAIGPDQIGLVNSI